MTLEKQTVAIPLGAGLQEGTGSKLLDPPAVLDLVDARWDKRGEYAKRYGATAIVATGISAEAKPRGLFEHDGALVQATTRGTYRYDENTHAWLQAAAAGPQPSMVRTDPLVRGNGSYRDADLAYDSATGLACVVYRDDDAAKCFSAFVDTTTGAVVARAIPVSGDHKTQPRVVSVNGVLLAFALDGSGNVVVATCDPTSAYAWTGSSSILSGCTAFDVHVASGEVTCHLAGARGASGWTTIEVDTTGTVLNTMVANTGREPTGIAVLHVPGSSTIYVLFDDQFPSPDQLSIDTFADDYSGSATKTKVLDYTVAKTGVTRRVAMARRSSDGLIWCFVSDDRGDGDTDGGIDFRAVNSSASPQGTAGWVPNLILATQAAEDSTGRVLVGASREVLFNIGGTTHEEPLPSGFLLTPVTLTTGGDSLAVVGRFGHDVIDCDGARSPQSDAFLGSLERVGSEVWGVYGVLVAANPGAPSFALAYGYQWGVDLLRAAFDARPERTQAEGLAVLAGGELAAYDGARMAELAIPVVPHPPLWVDGYGAAAVGATAPPNDYTWTASWGADGVEQYTVAELAWRYAFRWIDAEGNVHRSSVSEELRRVIAVSAQTADPASIDHGTWPTLYDYNRLIFFPKPSPTAIGAEAGAALQVELYRTAVIYRQYNVVAGSGNDTFVQEETRGAGDTAFRLVGVLDIGDVTGHPNLGYVEDPISEPDVPASGGPSDAAPTPYVDSTPPELASEPIGPTLDVCSTQQRLFAIDAEDRLAVRFTKPFVKGYAPEWNAALSLRCAAEGGDLVACEVLDDKLVLFKQERIYVTPVTSGPDATGGGQAFYPPREVAADVGCVSRASVVKGPFGIVFESARGIYLLDRSLTLTWIGEAVRDTVDGHSITSAVVVPEHNEVRFALDDDTAVVWEYRIAQWSRWDNVEAVDACMWRGRWARLISSSACDVRYESSATYDAGEGRPMLSITTAWIKIAALQGFKRVWRATLLGDYYASGHLAIDVGYDYESTWTDTHEFTEAQLSALARLQIVVRPSRQKCQAIRFRVRERVQSGQESAPTIGRGFVLQGIQLDVGMKRGAFKLLPVAAKT